MPYKSGKLKGELLTTELRKLIRLHNKLSKITIPTGSSRDDIIKIIQSNGYVIDHENQKFKQTRMSKDLSLKQAQEDLPKPKSKSLVDAKKKMKKEDDEVKKKKEVREIKKKAIEEDKVRRKKIIRDKLKKEPGTKPKKTPVKKQDELRKKEVVGRPRFDPSKITVIDPKKARQEKLGSKLEQLKKGQPIGQAKPKKTKPIKPKKKILNLDEVPKGSHRMPDGSIMKNSDMPKKERVLPFTVPKKKDKKKNENEKLESNLIALESEAVFVSKNIRDAKGYKFNKATSSENEIFKESDYKNYNDMKREFTKLQTEAKGIEGGELVNISDSVNDIKDQLAFIKDNIKDLN